MKRFTTVLLLLLVASAAFSQQVTYDMLKNIRFDQTHWGDIYFGRDTTYNIGSPAFRVMAIYVDELHADSIVGSISVDTVKFAWKSDTADLAYCLYGNAYSDTLIATTTAGDSVLIYSTADTDSGEVSVAGQKVKIKLTDNMKKIRTDAISACEKKIKAYRDSTIFYVKKEVC